VGSIINISEAASIALHSMVYIAAHKGNAVKIKQIAEYIKSSEAHVAKVLQQLNRKNLLSSRKGRNGGFILAKPPEEISYNTIFECIESEICSGNCPLCKQVCHFRQCIYGDYLKNVSSEIKTFFSNRYLSDVLTDFKLSDNE